MEFFPDQIDNDALCNSLDELQPWLQTQKNDLEARLQAQGAILFRGFPIKSADDFDAFSAAFNYDDFTYDESLSNAVRINLTPRVFTANEAPPDREIYLHHELAQTPSYPSKIFFCCLSAPEEGGATPLCRSDLLLADFEHQHPDWANQFAEMGLRYTIQMPANDDPGSGQGRSWRSTLSVTNQAGAENRLRELGYSWQWQEEQTLSATTPVMPAVRELADGSSSFFNQVIAVARGWRRGAGAPPPLTFGDGSPIDEAILDSLINISQRFTTPLQWKPGDIALIDNYRVMHGRHRFDGPTPRQVVVNLAR